MTTKRATTFITIAIILFIAAVAFFSLRPPAQEPATSTEQITPVRIAVATLVGSAPVYIAQKRGIFREEGLAVNIQSHATGKAALAAVLDGEADLATVAELPFVLAALQGADIQVIATICKGSREVSIVARKDRGIAKPEELRGKTVGVTLGTVGEFFLDEFCIMHGIPRAAITIIDLQPDELVDALVAGRIDAVSSWNPHTANLLGRLGDRAIPFYSAETYKLYWNVVATRDFIARHPDAIRRVVTALDRGNDYLRRHPDETRKATAEAIRIEPAQLGEYWSDYEFGATLDQAFVLTLENVARWALKRKKSPAREVPNFLDFLYLDALTSVRPDAVTVIR